METQLRRQRSVKALSDWPVPRRTFFGTTTEETVGRQIRLLWEIVGTGDDLCTNTFVLAVYENPSVPRRRNEIWFIRRGL